MLRISGINCLGIANCEEGGINIELLPLSSVLAASREKLKGKDMKGYSGPCDVKIGAGCCQNQKFPHGIPFLVNPPAAASNPLWARLCWASW